MQPTSVSVANGTYTYTASFDADLRLVTDSLTDGGTTAYSSTRGYDNVGNVISEDTTLTAGTDNQLFCYDEQNQLTWAGATGTSPCNGAVSAGTLTAAYYTQSYGYDAQGRLTSGAIGAYTYGDASHPHAVTSIGGGTYTASYDAAGDMTCRAPNSSVTCAGTPTGATLSYDAERRLAHWQNTPSTPTTQDDFLYDGEGQRVEQYVNTSGTITSTAYLLGGVEEVSNGVVTKYLGAKGLPTAVRVGTAGSLTYLAKDGLGSVAVAVDGSGNVVASQLFGPYGASRYSSGTMPTSKGFTGQRADAATGLDYYGARYYDPAAGQFVSADSVQQGRSRYAYVGGNPETATDPSGHLVVCGSCGNGGGPGGNGYVPPAPPGGYHCYSNCGGGGTKQCSGGNPKACSTGGGDSNKKKGNPQTQQQVEFWQGAYDLTGALASLYSLFWDILILRKDLQVPGLGIQKILNLLGDGLAILGDVLSLVGQIAYFVRDVFHQNVSGVLQWVDGIAGAIQGIKAVYNTYRAAASGFWGDVFNLGAATLQTAASLAINGEFLGAGLAITVGFAVLQTFNPDWDMKFLQSAGSGLFAGIQDAELAEINHLESE